MMLFKIITVTLTNVFFSLCMHVSMSSKVMQFSKE